MVVPESSRNPEQLEAASETCGQANEMASSECRAAPAAAATTLDSMLQSSYTCLAPVSFLTCSSPRFSSPCNACI